MTGGVNLTITTPTPNGDTDVWGTKLNTALTSLDGSVTSLNTSVSSLNTSVSTLNTTVAGKLDASQKSVANGVAGLDGTGTVADPLPDLSGTYLRVDQAGSIGTVPGGVQARSILCVGGLWQTTRPADSSSVTWIKMLSTDPDPSGALQGDLIVTPGAGGTTAKITRNDGDTGQPTETVVDTSTSASPVDNAFTNVTIGTGATFVFDTARALPGRSSSFRVATGATSASVFGQFGSSTKSLASYGSTIYTRAYVYLSANPTAAFHPIVMQDGAAAIRGRIRIRTDGKLAILAGTSATELVTTTATIPLNTWVRIQAKYVLSNTGTGTADVTFYTGESTTAVTGATASATAIDTVETSIVQVRYGVPLSAASIGPFWLAGLAVSDSPLGPVTADVFDTGIRPATFQLVVGTSVITPPPTTGGPGDGSGTTPVTPPADTTPPPTPPPTTADSAFITSAQALTLPKSGNGYNNALSIVNSMKAGSLSPNLDSVDTRDGSIALTCATFWLAGGKTDTALLAALKTFILKAPGTNQPATQALNAMRGIGGLLFAVDILKKNGGGWSDTATCPNNGNATFGSWLTGLESTVLGTGNPRWTNILTTAKDSPNNWGAVSRYALLGVAVARGDATLLATAVNLMRRYLGDTSVAAAFNPTGTYIASYDNTGSPSGKVNAGIGFVDAGRPGLDGIVIEDVNRGGTAYSASAAYFGVTGAGLTYCLEAADYVWSSAAVLLNLGYDVTAWSSNAIKRMGDWFNRAKSGTTTAYINAEGTFALYKNARWIGNWFAGGTPYGAAPATGSGTGGLSRSAPYADYLCGAGSTWLR